LIVVFNNDWKAYLFDQEFAFGARIKTAIWNTFCCTRGIHRRRFDSASSASSCCRALTARPAAGLLTRDLKKRMALSGVLGIVFCIAGLWTSYELSIASGAAIVTLSVLCYLAVFSLNALRLRAKRRAPASSSDHAVRAD
jgi:zinc transport system permease protein